ncbi:MAG: class I SAM-dependent methyltransferase [Proteobacteria bacterium]|nr:class I SAM-dependent methyltransferase [Pseudomonadota bacterium]
MQAKWDAIYSKREVSPTAALVLQQNQHLLPARGVALDLACGQGGNALLLAEAGLDTLAYDISNVAIAQLKLEASAKNLTINAQVRDVLEQPLEKASLDVLVISYFLDRALCSSLIDALKPSGLLFYQTYCQQKVNEQGPRNPDFLLKDNELLGLFSSMKVRVYREESVLGSHQKGWRNQAMLVAEK